MFFSSIFYFFCPSVIALNLMFSASKALLSSVSWPWILELESFVIKSTWLSMIWRSSTPFALISFARFGISPGLVIAPMLIFSWSYLHLVIFEFRYLISHELVTSFSCRYLIGSIQTVLFSFAVTNCNNPSSINAII
jgi:hypothetical protein